MVFRIVVTFLIFGCFIAGPVDAYAQFVPAPKVKLKKLSRNRGVNVSVSFKKQLRKFSPTIELQRAPAGGAFATVAILENQRKTAKFRDTSATIGTFFYRARITASRGASDWGPVKAVTIKPPKGAGSGGGGSNPPTNGVNCHDVPLPAGISECTAGYEEEVLRQVNGQRAAQNTAPIAALRALNCSARNHTIWMIQNNNFSHDGWLDFIRAAGFNGSAGENIAYGYGSPAAVMSGWMNSSGHRANILRTGWSYLGVSCLIGNGRIWWTQNFGG